MGFKLKKKKRESRDLDYQWKPIMSSSMYKEASMLDRIIGKGHLTYEKIEQILDKHPDLEDLDSRLLDYVYSNIERKVNTISHGIEIIANALIDDRVDQQVKDDIINDMGVLVDFKKDFEVIHGINPTMYIDGSIDTMNNELYRLVNNVVHEYTEAINDYIKEHGEHGVPEFEVKPEGYENSEASINQDYEFYNIEPEEEEKPGPTSGFDDDLVE